MKRLNAGRDEDLLKVLPGLEERARQLLAKERELAGRGDDAGPGRKGGIGTVELVLSGLRRQKRASQGWSAIGWINTDQAHAAGYNAMRHALVDKARARDRRPDGQHAGDLTSEFLAPLIEAGALNLEDLAGEAGFVDELEGVLRSFLEQMEAQRPDLAAVYLRVCLMGDSTEDVARELSITSRAVRFRLSQVRVLVAAHLVKRFPELRERLKPLLKH